MSDPIPPTSESEVCNVVETYTRAICSKDADAALLLHSPGLVQYLLAPPLQYSGSDALTKRGLQEWFDTFDGPIDLEWKDLAITAGPEIAFCHGLCHMQGTKIEGESVNLWFRNTYGLRKMEGTWKINHVHESVPFYMDGSARAALDLNP